MHKTIEFTIKGIAPLMMHNGQLANPLNPIAKAIKTYTSKRSKTDDDYEKIADLEWEGGLYLDEDRRVVLPGENLEAMLIKAAKKRKLGNQFKAGLLCDGAWPLKYDGPKDYDKLFADRRFRDMRNVNVNQGKVTRCRPIFPSWSLTFQIQYLADLLDLPQIVEAVTTAGRIIGLCEYTPKYGRFIVESK